VDYENSALTSNPLSQGEEDASAAGQGKLRHCKSAQQGFY